MGGINKNMLTYGFAMTDLSPHAQAVLEAYAEHNGGIEAVLLYERQAIAAVLRAAANQVAPADYASFTGHVEWDRGMETRNDSIRAALLAIAAELEQPDDM
jgi:hypothetical protein